MIKMERLIILCIVVDVALPGKLYNSTMEGNISTSDMGKSLPHEFLSVFNISSYQNGCLEHNDSDEGFEYHEELFIDDVQDLVQMMTEVQTEFRSVMTTVMQFVCTGNINAVQDATNMSQKYVQKCEKFLTTFQNATTVKTVEEIGFVFKKSVKDVAIVMHVTQLLRSLAVQALEVKSLGGSILESLRSRTRFNLTSTLAVVVQLKRQQVGVLQEQVVSLRHVLKYMEETDVSSFFAGDYVSNLLGTEYWDNKLCSEKEALKQLSGRLTNVQTKDFIDYIVAPIMLSVVFVVGLIGNGILLAIFFRHRDMRTVPNTVVLNLAVVDCLSLILNLPLDYSRVVFQWHFGLLGCQMFFFLGYLVAGVSTYSVVMLSVQRFMAVSNPVASNRCSRNKVVLMVLVVWIVGVAVAMPHVFVAHISKDSCVEYVHPSIGLVSTVDLMLICIVPLLLVAMFSLLTSARLKHSIHSIPGQTIGQEQLRHNRAVSSAILIALVIIFVITYIPNFMMKFVVHRFGIRITDIKYYLLHVITYVMMFANSSLNPIVLFALCSKFRRHVTSGF